MSVTQVERLAEHRRALLAEGTLGYTDYAQLVGVTAGAARARIARYRAAHRVLVVSQAGRVLLPAFQFRPDVRPRPELEPHRDARHGRVNGWPLWSWLARPTGWLSGEVSERVAVTNPVRALIAAQQSAAEFRGRRPQPGSAHTFVPQLERKRLGATFPCRAWPAPGFTGPQRPVPLVSGVRRSPCWAAHRLPGEPFL